MNLLLLILIVAFPVFSIAAEAGERPAAVTPIVDSNRVQIVFPVIELDSRSNGVAKFESSKPWTNSLGMILIPVGDVSFCIWKTRVQDFERFVRATHYNASLWVYSTTDDDTVQRGDDWQSPGFPQEPTCPVCDVSWNDAKAFCEWLTETERKAGLIGTNRSYRLPTDAEWSSAVGAAKYPWGDQWPPEGRAGNFADKAADLKSKIKGYNDGFSHTSPVGRFNANAHGLYDLGGNLEEWCEDVYHKDLNSEEIHKELPFTDEDNPDARVLRGSSWMTASQLYLLSAFRNCASPYFRCDQNGFRCVLAPEVPK